MADKPDLQKPQLCAEYQYRGSSVGMLTARRRQEIFIFSETSRLALRPKQPPMLWLSEALFLGVNRPGREADHLPSSISRLSTNTDVHPHFHVPTVCVPRQLFLYLYQ